MKHNRLHPLVTAVAGTIDREKMLQQGDRVLVGVSGGADSVVLLHILHQLAAGMGLHLGVAHLNHALRGKEADRDAAFVGTVARQLGLPCSSARQDVAMQRQKQGGSLEEAGRRARYRFYAQTAKTEGFAKIALGHHADDNAELVLMNILRGSGPGGMAGIPPTREPGIVRPLIHTKRHEILAYIKDNKLSYVEDASNQDTRFLRNRVRHELIPALREASHPGVTDALVRMASISRIEEEWLGQLTDRMLASAVLERQEQRLTLSTAYLTGLHTAAARRVVRGALKILKNNVYGIALPHIDAIIELIERGPEQGELHLPGQLRVRRKGLRLFLTKEDNPLRGPTGNRETAQHPSFHYEVPRPAPGVVSIIVKETGQKLVFSIVQPEDLPAHEMGGQNAAFFDMDKLDFPLMLRSYQTGDRFIPLGMQGSQKVKKFYINEKIARAQRKSCPILLTRGLIVWIVGHRLDDRFKIGPTTRNVLKAELLLA
ncbi:MAG: tRNA lysidine(34) synthetase TilS [Thermodesulfobacteriota bacterium]